MDGITDSRDMGLVGDSDGPVPLPVWAKWGGHPGPAPSPLVGVRGPTWVLKLKLQYFGHLMYRVDSFEKTLMLGKIEGRRRRRRQRMR